MTSGYAPVSPGTDSARRVGPSPRTGPSPREFELAAAPSSARAPKSLPADDRQRLQDLSDGGPELGTSTLDLSEFLLIELPSDTWGAGIVVIVKDLSDIVACKSKSWQPIRLLFAFGCLVTNLVLQFMLLFWVNEFVVNRSVNAMQTQYVHYHEQYFSKDGRFLEQAWANRDMLGDSALCEAGISNPGFLWGVLFLWAAKMLAEFRQVQRLHKHISNLPKLPAHLGVDHMVAESDDNTYVIVGLNPVTRLSLYLLIILPKFLINVILLYIGSRWLTATLQFGDLILNALALEFIVNIDELILESFFPERMKFQIDDTKFGLPRPPQALHSPEEANQLMWDYTTSMILVVFIALVMYVYLVYAQQVLPGYSHDIHACPQFMSEVYTPKCGFLAKDCFPYGHRSDTTSVQSPRPSTHLMAHLREHAHAHGHR